MELCAFKYHRASGNVKVISLLQKDLTIMTMNNEINVINKDKLKEGDIIFISIPSFLYRAIEKGTNSQTSHVGILLKENDKWMVAESKVPVSRLTPLEDFINRSNNSWFAIRRLNGDLSQEQIKALKKACQVRYGVLYDFSFNFHSTKLFCSKFVYEVFKEACDIDVGVLESFKTLINKNPKALTGFWKLWFLGFIPYGKLTVTPQSQITDKNLKEVIAHV
jgi:hypothetical protein